jgi:large subunit ribosomal protein L3
MKTILGKKLGMTQIFTEEGQVIPVTVIQAGPCLIVQIKNADTDGYGAIQVGFEETKKKHTTRPLQGHFEKNKLSYKRYLAEIRVPDAENYQVGQEIKADIFSVGDKVDVSGVSIGKGFAGVVKRWGFSGGPASHGSHSHRIPGSIGTSATPSHVHKGKALPGHMGNRSVTVQDLEVVRVDPDQNLLLVKGGVPGARGSLVRIKESVKSAVPKKSKAAK